MLTEITDAGPLFQVTVKTPVVSAPALYANVDAQLLGVLPTGVVKLVCAVETAPVHFPNVPVAEMCSFTPGALTGSGGLHVTTPAVVPHVVPAAALAGDAPSTTRENSDATATNTLNDFRILNAPISRTRGHTQLNA